MKGRIGKPLYVENCICLYDNQLVYVADMYRSKISYVSSQSYPEIRRSSLNSKWDFSVPRIGMINYNGESGYVVRNPGKVWRQGLTPGNTSIVSPTGRKINMPDPIRGDIGILESLNRALKNQYPSFEAALRLVNTRRRSVAFHKNFAITEDMSLIYKRNKIGEYVNGGISIHSIYDHLLSSVRSVIDEVA